LTGPQDTVLSSHGWRLREREAVMWYTLEHFFAERECLDPVEDELEQHSEYLHRCRRVQVGPALMVVFENSRTLRLRLRELARYARATEPARIHRAIGWYESLLPGPGRLLASVSVRAARRQIVRDLEAGQVVLQAGENQIRGNVRPDSAGDRIIGLVRWVEFEIPEPQQLLLQDRDVEWTLRVEVGDESFVSAPLGLAIRNSLLADVRPIKKNPRVPHREHEGRLAASR
jgi:hypothetical protein